MQYRFEIVFMFLYDVGRSIDLESLARRRELTRLPAIEGGRDTPASLALPRPLVIPLAESGASGDYESLRLRAKLYAEGVVTVECRALITLGLDELHTARYRTVESGGRLMTLDALAAARFDELAEEISPFVHRDQYVFERYERERYRVFCLVDDVGEPEAFVRENQRYIATLLLGENPELKLHGSQIESTLKTPFSFNECDYAIFDLDRAFLIDASRDYEDLLLIIEHANFQLLEFRTLDTLLDRWLDDAERGFRDRGNKRVRGPGFFPLGAFGALSQKLRNLQPLQLDALFLLENLENSSKIVGDYYLEQIYEHLCGIFNTRGWKANVERRLEILQNIYTMAKTDTTDRTMVVLELLVALMIAVELVALFLPILGH